MNGHIAAQNIVIIVDMKQMKILNIVRNVGKNFNKIVTILGYWIVAEER